MSANHRVGDLNDGRVGEGARPTQTGNLDAGRHALGRNPRYSGRQRLPAVGHLRQRLDHRQQGREQRRGRQRRGHQHVQRQTDSRVEGVELRLLQRGRVVYGVK